MSLVRRKILEREIIEHQKRYQRLSQKLSQLQKQLDLETRTEEKLRIENIVLDIQKERKELRELWEDLDSKLEVLKQNPSSTAELAAPQTLPRQVVIARESSLAIPPVSVFYSYAHEDEELRNKLNTHLKLLERDQLICGWHDRYIAAGREWENQIDERLEAAHLILLLISADFLASDYIYDRELARAMERHQSGDARVIPIILREVDWEMSPFGKLQALPSGARPVTSWENIDAAFADIAKGIREVAEEITGVKGGGPEWH